MVQLFCTHGWVESSSNRDSPSRTHVVRSLGLRSRRSSNSATARPITKSRRARFTVPAGPRKLRRTSKAQGERCLRAHHHVARATRGKKSGQPQATVAVFLPAASVLARDPPARPRVGRGGSSLEQRRAKRTPTSRSRQQRWRRCRRGGSATVGHSTQGVDGRGGGRCSRRRLGKAGANSNGLR